MPTSAAPPPSQVHPARQRALEASLNRLRAWIEDPAAAAALDKPVRISIGPRSLLVEPWESAQLKAFFAHRPGSSDEVRNLVAMGTALMIKSALDVGRIERLARQPCAEIFAQQAELMLDAALGMALLREVRGLIEVQVRTGHVEVAKSLSQLQHKLARAVGEAKQHIAESERLRADELVDDLTDVAAPLDAPEVSIEPRGGRSEPAPAAPPAPPASAGRVASPAGPKPWSRPRRASGPGSPVAKVSAAGSGRGELTATGVLALFLVLSVVAWAGLAWLPSRLEHRLPPLSRADLASPEQVDNLLARAPSVYVTIAGARWDAMSVPDRMALLQELGVAASMRGYVGLLVRTADGRPLGQWLRDRGTTLLEDREARPPTTEAGPSDVTLLPTR